VAGGGGELSVVKPRLTGRTLYDVAQLLQSGDNAEQRVRRVLELLHDLVPYEQCAMLEVRRGQEPTVVLVPEAPPDERVVLTRALVEMFGQLVDPNTRGRNAAPRPEQAHLAVPLVGLDEVIGLLAVWSSVTEYNEEDLCPLSVVAATLAAYFTIGRASADLAELASERDNARRVVAGARDAKDELLELVSSELMMFVRSTDGGPADDVESKILAQAQRLEDLLGQARLASAELRSTLRTVDPALLGEDPSSPGGWRRRGQLG
jgi:hypothetical protein